MSLLDDIRKIAISSVLEPDNDAQLRKLHRWFSTKFSVPLPEVEDLPTDYILLHYFEDMYSSMDEDDLMDEAKQALETPEQRQARLSKEKTLDDEFDKEVREEMEEQKKGGENKTLKDLLKKNKLLKKGKDTKKEELIKPKKEELKPPPPPPEIKLSFDDNDLMAKYGDTDFVPSKK